MKYGHTQVTMAEYKAVMQRYHAQRMLYSPGIVVSVNKCGSKEKVQILSELR